jgi:hypothetical protein
MISLRGGLWPNMYQSRGTGRLMETGSGISLVIGVI